jgi:hypothetical protein
MTRRFGQGNPEVEQIIAEMIALNASLRAIKDPGEVPDALRLVRQSFKVRKAPKSFEDFVIVQAMRKLLGLEPLKGFPKTLSMYPWTQAVFEVVGLAWVAWAEGKPIEAEKFVKQLWGAPERAGAVPDDRRGAVHLLALQSWAKAVEALAAGVPEEAERFFKRAAEIGASFGNESHPVVLWTMAASFAKLIRPD